MPCKHCGFAFAAHAVPSGLCINGRTTFTERTYGKVRFKGDATARVFDVVGVRPSMLAPAVRMLGLRPTKGRWPMVTGSRIAPPPVIYFPEPWLEEAAWLEERAS